MPDDDKQEKEEQQPPQKSEETEIVLPKKDWQLALGNREDKKAADEDEED